jgi:hypothetical protein
MPHTSTRTHALMICENLFQKKLLFLSGKGGVGKSILAASLALCAARTGRRILLVELDTIETLPGIFGVSVRQDPYREYTLEERIRCLHVDGRSGLEEYLEMVLKSKRLTRRIFRSPIYQYFVNIAPGLKELMAVGKLWDLAQKIDPGTGQPLHDLIIVDTPATGHTLSYLQMPITAADTVRKGFVNKEAQKVVDLLRDPARTSFNIVTTLAEMPVNEGLELHAQVTRRLHVPLGYFFINQVYPVFFQGTEHNAFLAWKKSVTRANKHPEEEAILACAESWGCRRAAQEIQHARLLKERTDPMVVLPLVSGAETDLEVARHLSRILASAR